MNKKRVKLSNRQIVISLNNKFVSRFVFIKNYGHRDKFHLILLNYF